MKIKVSNHIANLLVDNGVCDVFTVTGGGAMHLNDGLGHKEGLRCIYNHHEQASAIAAESYARINNKIAALCVTTGPGGTNAITGVVGGYLDSIPMLILSGQVRYDTTSMSTGLDIRAMGDQEFNIIESVGCMTKYSELITDPNKIKYCIEKALYIAQNGRPGPCWLDIPLNVQGAFIETDELEEFNSVEYESQLPPNVSDITVIEIINKIKAAKRPVLNVGNGVRIAGAHDNFIRVANKLNIPVVTGWNSIDAIWDDHHLYVGRAGIMGDRAGNWAIQNCDLLLSIGSRLSIRQVGYNYKTWAREAFTIVEDVDQCELRKPTVHVDMPIWADARDLLVNMDRLLPDEKLFDGEDWIDTCKGWKRSYPVVLPHHYEDSGLANVYAFIKELSSKLCNDQITVVGNGSACVVGSQGYIIKKGQRFIINSAIASMGYDLPAAIGAVIAANNADIDVICITGDGSIQMNLQELQTIIHHKMPIKIFVINNEGYHSIRQTQKNFFGEPFVGIGNDSGDLSFPSLKKLAVAYGYPYVAINNNSELANIDEVLSLNGPAICEVFVTKDQIFEPKSATKRLDDGTFVSAPLEDLAPFLSADELKKIMIIPMIEE